MVCRKPAPSLSAAAAPFLGRPTTAVALFTPLVTVTTVLLRTMLPWPVTLRAIESLFSIVLGLVETS